MKTRCSMTILIKWSLGIVAVALCSRSVAGQEKRPEFNTWLMESTFRISGDGTPKTTDGKLQATVSLGTGFILGRPIPNTTRARYVLVTANHVLDQIASDNAILSVRRNLGQNKWEPINHPIQIREKGKPLWSQPKGVDVAAMYVNLPTGVLALAIPTTFLAADKELEEFEIHPGDSLSSLGFPFGIGGPLGFPLLRSGKIASYPLVPTDETKTFAFDFSVFEGNSGGPVYFVETNRTYGGSTRLGTTITVIVGLVSQQVHSDAKLFGKETPISLALVVHASQIRKAVELLPSPVE